MSSVIADPSATVRSFKQPPTAATVRIEPPRGLLELRVKEVWMYRELLLFLVWRDLKVRYKQTAIGVAWVVLQPLMSMGVFTLFFGPPGRWRFFLHRCRFYRHYFHRMSWRHRFVNLLRLLGAPLVGYRYRHWPEETFELVARKLGIEWR